MQAKLMKHTCESKAAQVQVRTSEAFSRMEFVMENLLAAAPEILAANIV